MRVLSILADDACSSSQSGQCWTDFNLPSTVHNLASVACSEDSSVLLLNENGSLIKQEQKDQQQLEDGTSNFSSSLPGSVESVKFASVFSSFGTNLALSLDGRLFAWGESSFGQCGCISDEPITEPRQVDLRGPAASCKHGRQTIAKSLKLKLVAAGERVVCVVDDADQIWTYGALRGDGVPVLDPIKLVLPPGRQVVSIVSGKRHFIALVRLKAKDDDGDAVFQESDISLNDDSTTFCDNCTECVEDKRLRFSVLIQEANEKHAKSSFDRDTILEQRAEHAFCGEGLKLVLDVPSPTRKPDRSRDKRSHANTMPLMSTGREGNQRQCDEAEEPLLNRRNRSVSDYFSFVSLDMLADTFADSDKDSSITTVSSGVGPSLTDSSLEPRAKTLTPFSTEIWTWGSNFCGQLGHGDFIDRREPSRVDRLSDANVVKIVAGDEHTAVLTATGEVFVWGSNNGGQLKKADQPAVSVPMLFKVGSQSSVLDIAAGSNHTSLIVNGIDSTPTVYYCGKSATENVDPKTTTCRLSFVDKIGWPIAVHSCGKQLLVAVLPREGEESLVANAFALIFADLKFARVCAQLKTLAHQLFERSLIAAKPTLAELLRSFAESMSVFADLAASVAERSRGLLSGGGCAQLDALLSGVKSNLFLDAIQTLHDRFANCVAYGCFADFDIGEQLLSASATVWDNESNCESLTTMVDKLCLEHETESRKQHRQLRKLFQLVFARLKDYRETATVVIDRGNQDAETKATLVDWTQKWRALEQWMTKVGSYADETFNLWRERSSQNEAYTTLKKPGRFVVSHEERASAECQVKAVQGPNGAIKTWQSLVVFNDSIAVIERKEFSLFEFPLVWVNPVTHDTKHLVRLLSPENDITIEFSSAQAKTDFAQSAGLWRRRVPLDKAGREATSALPVRRQGVHRFSVKHPQFSSCRYEGGWIQAKPHGSGKLFWSDGRIYIGRFRDGIIQGLGTMRVPVEGTAMVDGRRLVDTMTGVWKNGKLNGLAFVQYASGSSYEGYMKDSLKHGHGVLRASNSHNLYVGAWHDDKKQGYGVFSTQRERYLGMWFDDQRNGLGAVVTIDGVFHEGLFEKDRLVKGKLICTDGTVYDGEFNGAGVCNGKGTLYVTPSDKIEGMMYGNLLAAGQLKLSNAIYSKTTVNPGTPVTASLIEDHDRSLLLNSSTWTVPADQKWTEMFDQFISEELRVPYGGRPDTTAVWSAIAASMAKVKLANITLGIAFDDRLEKVPTDVEAEWTAAYYDMVCDFWTMAIASKFHPLSRLVHGLVEVFASSYNNIAAHKSLVDHAVVEFRSIIRRTYAVMRYLFPSLPPESEMHLFVPLPEGEERPSDIPPTACDFVLNDFLSRSYAVLQTVYAVGCEDMDARYWERATVLSSRSDVTLLDFLDVKRHLWPIEIQTSNVLDTPMICATAKKQYYKSAIDTLQLLNSVFTPSAKLRILSDTFAEVNKCVNLHASAGDKHVWNTDDLFPVFLFVVVRAQLQRLGATIRMIDDLTPQMQRLGHIELMFTTLKASYYQIIKEKSLP